MNDPFGLGDDGKIHRVYYGLRPAKLFLGIATLGERTRGFYADLSLKYELADEPKALVVVRALDRQQLVPRLFVTESNGQPYVAALFQPRIDDELLREIIPAEIREQDILAPTATLVMTAESDFDQPTLDAFMAMFRQNGNFRLQIADRAEESQKFEVKWYSVLTTIEQGWPKLI